MSDGTDPAWDRSMTKKALLPLVLLTACGGEESDTSVAQGELIALVEVAPLKLTSLWMTEPASQLLVSGWLNASGRIVYPGAYDLVPTWVHLKWTYQSNSALTAADIHDIVNGNGWAMELWLNGEKLTRGPNGLSPSTDYYGSSGSCGQFGGTCVTWNIRGTVMPPAPGPYSIDLVYWELAPYRTPKQHVYSYADPNPDRMTYFGDQLVPTFRHTNCTTCHSLVSKQSLVDQHHGLLDMSWIYETPTPRGTQLRCLVACHNVSDVVPGEVFGEIEWMAPAFDMGIDFSQKTNAQICQTVKMKLPTAAALSQHFLDDARIAWAVNSGQLPLAYGNKGTAPPNSYAAFVDIISAWVSHGAPCP